MKTFYGQFYASYFALPAPATVVITSRTISIGYTDTQGIARLVVWKLSAVGVGYLEADQCSQFLVKDQQTELRVPASEAADYALQLQDLISTPWYRKGRRADWYRIGGLLSAFAVLLCWSYFYLLPWMASQVAGYITPEQERQLGDAVYSAMQLQEDSAGSVLLTRFFDSMQVSTAYDIRIALVHDNTVNAFALPGGRLVVYSGLLQKMGSYPELAALLGHEFSHVQQRHATRSICRQLGSALFFELLLGQLSSAGSVLAGQTEQLRSLSYSRELEKEADLQGLALLQRLRIDPQGFYDLFGHLKDAEPSLGLPEIISSHPDTDNRVAYIKKAATPQPVAQHPSLRSIFDQLKTITP